jgi:hypothetical protein
VKDQLIEMMFVELRALNSQHIGIMTPSGHVFPPDGDSAFRQKVMAYIASLEANFEGAVIPDELLSLMIAHAIRKALEQSSLYVDGRQSLPPRVLQHIDHELNLIFTQCAQLKKLREEPSYRDLGDYRPTFEHGFHGEFSYALLHLLNGHRLHVRREDMGLMFQIANTANKTEYITEREGSPLGWRAASPYAVDPLLSERKEEFCAAIDAREPRGEFDDCVVDKSAPAAPVTLALWNRNAEGSRDPNRRLSLNMVQNIVMYVREQIGLRTLRLLIVGDGGRLPGIESWAHTNGIECHEHRTEHMFPKAVHPLTAPIPKNEQLYRVRNIMRKFNPDLIVGARSGLVALCALVGCPGLQLDMADASSTSIITRVSRKGSPSKASAFEAPYKTRDNRLLEIFARCPVDGLGPHLELVASSPNPDTARINAFSQTILELTISVMMVVHDDFKPLMLETLASYLSGDAQALQRLRVLLHTYHLSQARFKAGEVVTYKTFDNSRDDGDGDDARDFHHDDSNHDGKTGGSARGSSRGSTSAFHGSRGGFDQNTMYQARLSQHEGKVMDSKAFFGRLEAHQEDCKAEFSRLKTEEKSSIFIYSVLNSGHEQFMQFYQNIIPEGERDSVLRYDNFIIFEHAFSRPEYLNFLLPQLGDGVSALFENDYFLRCALQLKPHMDAKVVFEMLKLYVNPTIWIALCVRDDSVLVRAIAENIDADYAWEQCTSLSYLEKKNVLMADNHMVFRRAALLAERVLLLEDMGRYLTPEEFKFCVNAYGGDIVYQAMIAKDKFFFNHYYPMLDERARLDLAHRIETEAPDVNVTFREYIEALQHAPVPAVSSHTMDSAPHTPVGSPSASSGKKAAVYGTPQGVMDLQTTPNTNERGNQALSGQQAYADLNKRSGLLFPTLEQAIKSGDPSIVGPQGVGLVGDNDGERTEVDGSSSSYA